MSNAAKEKQNIYRTCVCMRNVCKAFGIVFRKIWVCNFCHHQKYWTKAVESCSHAMFPCKRISSIKNKQHTEKVKSRKYFLGALEWPLTTDAAEDKSHQKMGSGVHLGCLAERTEAGQGKFWNPWRRCENGRMIRPFLSNPAHDLARLSKPRWKEPMCSVKAKQLKPNVTRRKSARVEVRGVEMSRGHKCIK